MIYIKKYLIPILINIAIILFGSLFTSILYYFDLTTDKINNILLYLVSISAFFISSLMLAKNSKYKGLITGLFYFLFWFVIMIFLSIVIFKNPFEIKNMIYDIILLLFTLLGAIIGKNMQKENDTI